MNLYKYYLEIKNRFLLALTTWISVVLVSYYFKEFLLFVFTKSNFYSSYPNNESLYFIFTDVTEIFSVYLSLIFFVANQITGFYFLYHLFIFISLGLYSSEYKYLLVVFKISVCFFFLSIIVFNKILFPLSWDFFSGFQNLTVLKYFSLHFEAKLNEYLAFYITFYYICIFYFQTFTGLVIFFNYVKEELKLIKNFRKVFYYSFLIFSTLVTPPDIFSQLLLSLIIIINYEILVLYVITRNYLKNFNLVTS